MNAWVAMRPWCLWCLLMQHVLAHGKHPLPCRRLAGLGAGFRKYKPCSCRTRSGMLAPRPPLRLSHLLEQSDDDL